ncbi:MAG: class II aldolase/adducin family protein [Spirochaetes bacterium]|nr:MAG: class II aldolase/adducin family protein [Spirochaetota bacterium]
MSIKIKNELKEVIIYGGLTMVKQRLTVGTWGNISIRDTETGLIYISPSGIDYADIRVDDIVVLNSDMEVIDGKAVPSIEKGMHIAVYNARKDVNTVIHTHPIYSSVLGVNHMELPGISEDFVQIVGDKIICSKYALPGTSELATNAVKALGSRNAVILPNHGTLCVGKNLKDALKISYVVEKTAHVYIMAKSIGAPYLISEHDIKVMQEFARNHYGQRE